MKYIFRYPLIGLAIPIILSGCSKTELINAPFSETRFNQQPLTTFMTDGGWCWYQDPRAIIHQDQLIIGGISGKSGDIRVSVFDLKSNKIKGEVVLDASFELDDHNAPVFYLRPDNRLVAKWAEHGKENLHYYRISEPNDYLTWGKLMTHQHPFDKGDRYWGGVTYMNLYSIERQERVYNFFRLGMDLNPYFNYSDDYGSSWQGFTHFIKDEVPGKHRPYSRYVQQNANSIGINFTDAHPRDYGNSLYYASFDGTSFYRADGSKIKELAKGPLSTNEAEKIYQGSETHAKPEGYGSVPNSAWTVDVEVSEKQYPYVGYSVYQKDNDIRFRLANWNGERWNDREIAYAGRYLYKIESSYSGLLALDPELPENMIISSDVNPSTGENKGGTHEIYVSTIKPNDNISTINWHPITKNSEVRNIRPTIVTGEGYKVMMWMRGEFNHFQDYDTNIVGHVVKRP